MAIKTSKEKVPLDYLEEKVKQMMLKVFVKYKTTIPWDGMLDIPSKDMVKMIKKEICDA